VKQGWGRQVRHLDAARFLWTTTDDARGVRGLLKLSVVCALLALTACDRDSSEHALREATNRVAGAERADSSLRECKSERVSRPLGQVVLNFHGRRVNFECALSFRDFNVRSAAGDYQSLGMQIYYDLSQGVLAPRQIAGESAASWLHGSISIPDPESASDISFPQAAQGIARLALDREVGTDTTTIVVRPADHAVSRIALQCPGRPWIAGIHEISSADPPSRCRLLITTPAWRAHFDVWSPKAFVSALPASADAIVATVQGMGF